MKLSKVAKVMGYCALGTYCTGYYINAMTSKEFELWIKDTDSIPKQIELKTVNYTFKGFMFMVALMSSVRTLNRVKRIISE